jgi:hypothetical protein
MVDQIKLNLRQQKQQRMQRRREVVDSFRPLTFAADTIDLAVQQVSIFPERDCIIISLRTFTGTATMTVPYKLAHELGDGLCWLVQHEQQALAAR